MVYILARKAHTTLIIRPATRIRFRTPRQMEAQANTTREQSNKNNLGWRPSHGENGGVGKKKIYI